jgi:protein ImuB
LQRLGLKRIGQLYALPRASLERRFHAKDTAEAVLLRLDQALGRHAEPHAPLLPSPDFVTRLPFPEPLITPDGVLAGLDHLASALCAKLARAGRGCRRIALWVCRTDGSSTVIEAGLSVPSREPKHLLRLVQDKIEAIDMGFGVDLMALTALVTEPLCPAQTSLTEANGKIGPEALIDRLVNRLGARGVHRLFPRASHIPELAQRLKSAFAGPSLWPAQPEKPPRPPLLVPSPEPLAVLAEIPEGPPARFTWRRVTRRVVKAEGPERIAPEWWLELRRLGATSNFNPPPQGGRENKGSPDSRPRDYYRIEDEEGHRYWVFREGLYQESELGAPCWFLHGVFG